MGALINSGGGLAGRGQATGTGTSLTCHGTQPASGISADNIKSFGPALCGFIGDSPLFIFNLLGARGRPAPGPLDLVDKRLVLRPALGDFGLGAIQALAGDPPAEAGGALQRGGNQDDPDGRGQDRHTCIRKLVRLVSPGSGTRTPAMRDLFQRGCCWQAAA